MLREKNALQYFLFFAQRHGHAHTSTGRPTPGRLRCLACITCENRGWRDAQHASFISINTVCASWNTHTTRQCLAGLCHVVLRRSCTTSSFYLAAVKGAKLPLYDAAGESVLLGLATTEMLRGPWGSREFGKDETRPPSPLDVQ